MDKRVLANQEAKNKIINALFKLMKKERFSEITVTEIINEAGVARATYYRNFDSKEEIIESYLEEFRIASGKLPVIQDLSPEAFSYENLVARLTFIASQKDWFLLLYQNGFYEFLQTETNQFAELVMGDMPSHSVERYNIYLISGALLNMLLEWMKNDCKESPEALATLISKRLPIILEGLTEKIV